MYSTSYQTIQSEEYFLLVASLYCIVTHFVIQFCTLFSVRMSHNYVILLKCEFLLGWIVSDVHERKRSNL